MSVGFNPDGTYQVVCYIIGGPGSSPCLGGKTVASGTWLPGGRSTSDYTISVTLTPSVVEAEPPVPSRRDPGDTDGDSEAGSAPGTSPNLGGYAYGSGVTSVTANGATGAGVIALAAGHDFMRSDPPGSLIGGVVKANVSVVITDRRDGSKTTATFAFDVTAR